MSIEIKVPSLPESVADATLVTWHKSVGDTVERDENLADLETDKVVLEVPSPVRGVLRELLVQAGATVVSGQLLAVLDSSADAAPVAAIGGRSAVKAGPGARRVLQETGVDPATIQGTGRDGRILKSDVLKAPPPSPPLSPAAVAAPAPAPVGAATGRTGRPWSGSLSASARVNGRTRLTSAIPSRWKSIFSSGRFRPLLSQCL